MGPRESLGAADATRQGDRRKVGDARHGDEEGGGFVGDTTLGNHLLEFLDPSLKVLQVGQQVVDLELIDWREGNLLQPDDGSLGWELLGRHLPLQVVTPEDVFDLIDKSSPCSASILP